MVESPDFGYEEENCTTAASSRILYPSLNSVSHVLVRFDDRLIQLDYDFSNDFRDPTVLLRSM